VESVLLSRGKAAGVIARRPSGGTEELRARLVVGADGVHSAVVRSLGLAAPLRWPQNLGLVAHYRGTRGWATGERCTARRAATRGRAGRESSRAGLRAG